jgi:tRNA-Thr(GGU) m(6)t(6)A37 methyltransferase TsaA
MILTPIGIYHSDAKAPYEAARQPLERITTRGEVILSAGQQFEQALENLEGFERLWLIYQFHHNPHWKPKVRPPRGSDTKVGVFATRAPYRPNALGISCVKLLKVENLKLVVEGADLLDGTPIFDIKPYLPYADSFPDARIGWLEGVEKFSVELSAKAEEQIAFLQDQGIHQLRDFIFNQLEYDPANGDKKRVTPEGESFVLAYKTWRARFRLDDSAKAVTVTEVFSGYTQAEVLDPADPYQDKAQHRAFRGKFPPEIS